MNVPDSCSVLGCTSCMWIYCIHSSSQANSAFCAGGGKERAEEAADYGRERARAAQDRLNRTADSYPSGGEIRREGRAALPSALVYLVIISAVRGSAVFLVVSCHRRVQPKMFSSATMLRSQENSTLTIFRVAVFSVLLSMTEDSKNTSFLESWYSN